MLLFFSTTSPALTTLKRDERELKNSFIDANHIPLPTSTGWMNIFGGTDYYYYYYYFCYYYIYSVQNTTDEGYIITGSTYSFDAWY